MISVQNRDGLRKLKGEREPAPVIAPPALSIAPAPAPDAPARDMGPQMAHMQMALHLQAENLTRATELLAASLAPQAAKKMTSIVHRDSAGRMVRIETTIERT